MSLRKNYDLCETLCTDTNAQTIAAAILSVGEELVKSNDLIEEHLKEISKQLNNLGIILEAGI